MRKRNFSFALDNLLWWIVYLLPVFGWLFSLMFSETAIPFNTFILDIFSLQISSDNVLLNSFWSIFGSNGVFPLISNQDNGFMLFVCYFLSAYFIHIAVDLLMLLPRMVMHGMDKLGGEC